MTSRIYNSIAEHKIKVFLSLFSDTSQDMFFDSTKKNKLFHAGEFGRLREQACKALMKPFIPSYLDIATNGFVINSFDDVSKENDLIFYDNVYTPIIKGDDFKQFFPIETVAGVGQVKSDLSIKELKNALIELSNLKEMRTKIKSPEILRRPAGMNKSIPRPLNQIDKRVSDKYSDGDYLLSDAFEIQISPYNPSLYHCDQIFTFLICHDVKSKPDKILNTLEEIAKTNISNPSMNFNVILILKKNMIVIYRNSNTTIPYPMWRMRASELTYRDGKNFIIANFKAFLSFLHMMSTSSTIIMPEMLHYLDIWG